MSIDTSKLPKYAQRHLAALEQQIADQKATIDEMTQALADKPIAQVNEHIEADYDESIIARVNQRTNQHGDILNCMINPEFEGELNIRTLAKALRTTLAPRGKRRTDRDGNVWVDVYPSVSANTNLEEAA